MRGGGRIRANRALTQIVGMKIRRLRLKRGYSQEDLAEQAGLHPTYIGQVERGEKNMTIDSLSKIAAALNVPISSVFDEFDGELKDENFPFLAYQLLSTLNDRQQEKLYGILKDICDML